MGLFAIPIQERVTTTEIVAILKQHGYSVSFERRTDNGAFYSVPTKRRGPMKFWITSATPNRFCVGAGSMGAEIVQVLAGHGVFATQ